LIVTNNLLLNYDLMQMIMSPYHRNVRKSINFTNTFAGLYVLVAYITIPVISISNKLNTPDRIKLRAQDTVMVLIENTMILPDSLLCLIYFGYNIYVLWTLV
jgi:hypothetical protein